MMHKLLALVLITSAIYSCKPSTDTTPAPQQETVTPAKPAPAADNRPRMSLAGAAMMTTLQGQWTSVEDPSSSIEFEGNTMTSRHKHLKNDIKASFSIGDVCNGTTTRVSVPDPAKYIVIPESNLCYHIVSVDKEGLVLQQVGTQTKLTYTKI